MTLSRCIALAALSLVSHIAQGQGPAEGARLGNLTWPQAEERIALAPMVIVPFGAGAKEHGPHLPMNADAVVMQYLVDEALRARDVVVAPPILHGWFPAFRGFPGTEVDDAAVFSAYVQAVGMSLVRGGAKRLLFLNTGIANATGLPIAIAAREIRAQTGVPTMVVSWGDLETDQTSALQEQREGGHSDEIETSINLYLQPERVLMSLAVRDYGPQPRNSSPGYQPGVFSRDASDPNFSETGLYGDPTFATAEKGEAALAIMTEQWLKAIDGFAATPVRRRP